MQGHRGHARACQSRCLHLGGHAWLTGSHQSGRNATRPLVFRPIVMEHHPRRPRADVPAADGDFATPCDRSDVSGGQRTQYDSPRGSAGEGDGEQGEGERTGHNTPCESARETSESDGEREPERRRWGDEDERRRTHASPPSASATASATPAPAPAPVPAPGRATSMSTEQSGPPGQDARPLGGGARVLMDLLRHALFTRPERGAARDGACGFDMACVCSQDSLNSP